MIITLVVGLAPIAFTPTFQGDSPTPEVLIAEFDSRLGSAGQDVDKLWALAEVYDTDETEDQWKEILNTILEIDTDHAPTRKALRHHNYDGQWFETYTALSTYKRAEAKRMFDEHGLVRFGDDWAKPDEVPFLRMGWAKDESGEFVNPVEIERRKHDAEMLEQGYQQQDMTWIPPAEFDQWSAGLHKCGDDWLTVEQANEFHSKIYTWWQVPGEHFITYSTCERGSTDWARWYADSTYENLVRIYGVEPSDRPGLVVLKDLDQYNRFANGDQAIGHPPVENTGHSSTHYAFFAEMWVNRATTPATYVGTGVAYWVDANWGPYAVRHAAGHAFAEAVDPSWEAVSHMVASPSAQFQFASFWSEKRVPRWLRYGAASYVERFFYDTQANVDEGGDPWGLRAYFLDDIRKKGGVASLDEVFAFNLDPGDQTGLLIAKAGAVVSFILDGENQAVTDAHKAFKDAMAAGEDTKGVVEELQNALNANAAEVLEYINGPGGAAVSGAAEASVEAQTASGGEGQAGTR